MARTRTIYDKSLAPVITFDRVAIGQRIGDARRARGWTQDQLREAVGAGKGTIEAYENGLRLPLLKTMIALSVTLRRSLDHLLLGRGRNAKHWPLPVKQNHSPSNPPLDGGDACDDPGVPS